MALSNWELDMTLETIGQHVGRLWIFQGSAPVAAVLAILLLDMGLTLYHSIQELRGKLWRYFGAIVGADVPDKVGIPGFFIFLTLALWSLSLAGLVGLPSSFIYNHPSIAAGAVAALIGARLSDSWFSHIRLARKGYTPNPGLSSTKYYVIEGLALTVVFAPGLWAHKSGALLGASLAILFFPAVLPALRFLRNVHLFGAAERWQEGSPPPKPAPIWTS